MAKISGFMICSALEQYSQPDGGTGMIARDPNFVLHPPCIPSAFTFAAIIGIRGLNTSKPNIVRTCVISPDGKVIHDSGSAQFPPVAGRAASSPNEYRGAVVGYTIQNLLLDSEGIYHLECNVNGEDLTPQEVPVFV